MSSRAFVIVLLLAAPQAMAFDSACRQYADPSLDPAQLSNPSPCAPEEGPNTARQRWVGPLDEHRQLFERARGNAGLPASLSATLRLRVFTSADPVAINGASVISLRPVAFQDVLRAQTRFVSIGELAQLPDWSYSLWDWAMGNEVCPIDPSTLAEDCHGFGSHMGPVNSNHFLPQAQAFYRRYHALALGRAAACRAMQSQLGADAARFSAYVGACEEEALAIEAVGQHFLQDAFSSGHMWERWGSPDLTDFPGTTASERHDRAVLIALVSGMIHGSRAVLQKLPDWTTFDVNDALCAPQDGVAFALDGTQAAGLGDDYLFELPGPADPSPLAPLAARFDACAASGVREVYLATAQVHGAAQPLASGVAPVDPLSPACFGQRVTDQAMSLAAGLQFRIAGQQFSLPLDSRVAGWMVPKMARLGGGAGVPAALRNEFRFSVQRVVSIARIRAALAPQATGSASGGLGDLLGMAPNSTFASKAPLASYVDPDLPWPGDAMRPFADRQRALAMARLFHRSHVDDLCGATAAADLDALRAHAADASLDGDGHAAACEACKELGIRHLRVGSGPSSYDTSQEPICARLSGTAPVVYQAGADPAAAIAGWCGC